MYTSMHIDIHIFCMNTSTYLRTRALFAVHCRSNVCFEVFLLFLYVLSLTTKYPSLSSAQAWQAMQRLGEGRCGKSEPFPNGETTLLANRLQSKFQGSMLCYNLRLLGGIFYAPLLSLLLLLTSFWFSGWWMPYPVSRSQVFQLAKTG